MEEHWVSIIAYDGSSKKCEQNNKIIVVNILFVPCNTKQIGPAYISKYNNMISVM